LSSRIGDYMAPNPMHYLTESAVISNLQPTDDRARNQQPTNNQPTNI